MDSWNFCQKWQLLIIPDERCVTVWTVIILVATTKSGL